MGSTAAGLVAANTWVYIEVQVTLGDSPAGALEVRINGTQRLALTNQDTKFAGTKTVYDQVRLVRAGTNVSNTNRYDDLYITTGPAVFKGDIVVP